MGKCIKFVFLCIYLAMAIFMSKFVVCICIAIYSVCILSKWGYMHIYGTAIVIIVPQCIVAIAMS